MTDPIEPLIPLPFVFNTTQRITRDVSQTLTQFLNNLIYNSTTPLSFETYPEDIYTAPLIREHHDSYLYFIETHSLVLNSEEPPFSILFTSLKNRSDTFRKNIYPNNIYIPIAKVFTTFLNHLQENNNLLTKHVFNPSSIQDLLQKESLFNLSNIEQFRTIENNPHHWLTTDILQIHHFQYQFFQNLTLNTKTKEQIQIYSLFLRKFFRQNYQLVWHSKFQDACINFPQQFSSDELLPFIINSDSQHKQYYNLLDFPSSHFQYLAYDPNSLNKSLNLPSPIRPYTQQSYLPPSTDTTSNISIQTLPSSSNALINPISLNNQHNPTSTSQVTLNNENLSPSNSPNQYNTPSNTPPAVPPNSVSLSNSFIPTLPPIPLSFNNTLPTQSFPKKILQSLLFLKLLLLLHNLPHIILMFLFIQLFKISPLTLTNLLLTPLNLLFPLQQSLSTPLLFNHLLFPTPLLSLLLHFPIPLNCLMALIILIPLKNSWHILVLE